MDSIFAFCFLPVLTQYENDDCLKQIEYVSRNQVDPPKISLRRVEGRAVDSNGVAVGYICIALFTEKEHRFVAQTVADKNGYFRFGKISKGNYRLVARVNYDYLCPVNVRIRRAGFLRGGFFRKTRLVLHLRVAAIDVCSYADTK